MKIIRGLAGAAVGILLFVSVILFLPGMAGIFPYVVLSGSMEPALRTGGVAFADTRCTEPEVGDIILFRRMDSLVTHRVIHIENGRYITKGDANVTEDVIPVSAEQVVGKVMFALPFLGYVVSFFQTRAGIATAALLVLCNGWINIRKGERTGCAQETK